jgi:hypothetical protein
MMLRNGWRRCKVQKTNKMTGMRAYSGRGVNLATNLPGRHRGPCRHPCPVVQPEREERIKVAQRGILANDLPIKLRFT